MGKYDEIMNRIELTPEAKERILANVSLTAAESPETETEGIASPLRGKISMWKRVLPAAAMVTLVLAAALMAKHFGGITDIVEPPTPIASPGSQNAAVISESSAYNSREELEEGAGFPMEELRGLPFAAETVSYDLTDGIAETTYTGEGKTALFRKAGEEKTLSNAVYPVIREIEAGEIRAVIGGENERFSLAVWKHGGYSYCLELSEGVGEETIAAMIAQTAADGQ
jgi:hypothetical protein